jgi:hypothetical protein
VQQALQYDLIEVIHLKYLHITLHYMFDGNWCVRFYSSSVLICVPVYGSFFLLCCVCLCVPVYTLVYPIVMGRSYCCVVCVSVCGPVYALVYPIVMGRSYCCVVCVCMWSCLCASVSHCDGPFLLLCCVCMWSCLCASVSHCDGPFFLLCCVCLCVVQSMC